jgi:hypothetical protein
MELMKIKSVIYVLLFLVFQSCSSPSEKKQDRSLKILQEVDKNIVLEDVEDAWYVGGTLHKATILQWKNATEHDKLATCGDFIAKTNKTSSLSLIKLKATDLRICINEAIKGHDTADTYAVSDVASLCLLLLNE